MATKIREAHRLLTVNVTLRPSRAGGRLLLQGFHGRELLSSHDLPAEDVGIVRELSIRTCREARFALPEDVLQAIAGSLRDRSASSDEPRWLQLGPSAGHLAIVPWERLIQPSLDAPLLRVPNFLVDPTFLTGRLRLVLVVSSPRAKEHFPLQNRAEDLVELIQQAVPHGTEIHLFADAEAHGHLSGLPTASGPHTLVVHDPATAESLGSGTTSLSRTSAVERLESPWLRWIQERMRGSAVDAVHFMCPGYFRAESGALALARSPASNEDRQWSHFVSADELRAFLTLVGAWVVGFSPPTGNVWSMGLRLLADRLAWEWSGALLLHDLERAQPQEFVGAYAFLFQHGEPPPPASPDIMLYTHPRRMQRYRSQAPRFESVTVLGFGGGSSAPVPEQLVKLARKEDRAARASVVVEDPDWKQANRLRLDQMLFRLGDQDTPARRGVLDALDRVRDILGQGGA